MTDGAGAYGNNERCRVLALRPLFVHTMQYEVETRYDYLTVNGVQYTYSGPDGVKMAKGAALVWYSDGSGNTAGWKVCADEKTTTTKPTKKGRYIPHPPHADAKQGTSRLTSPRRTSPCRTSPHLAPQSLNDYGKNVNIVHACAETTTTATTHSSSEPT